MVMDTNINKFQDQKLTTAVLTTDLSAAYDTVDSMILSNKLEHLGIRGREQELFRTYLTDKWAYVEIQGFQSKLLKQPDCSVIQGSKLLSTLYTT